MEAVVDVSKGGVPCEVASWGLLWVAIVIAEGSAMTGEVESLKIPAGMCGVIVD